MDVKKCDHCGKIFDLDKLNGERELSIRKYGESHWQAKALDLCADCVEALKEWLKGGKI